MRKSTLRRYVFDDQAFKAYKKFVLQQQRFPFRVVGFMIGLCVGLIIGVGLAISPKSFLSMLHLNGLQACLIAFGAFIGVPALGLLCAHVILKVRDRDYQKVCDARAREKSRHPFDSDYVKPAELLKADMQANDGYVEVIIDEEGCDAEYQELLDKATKSSCSAA